MKLSAVSALALLLAASGLASCKSDAVDDTVFPNAPVILISIDSLRADHLPAYGYTKIATPAIDPSSSRRPTPSIR